MFPVGYLSVRALLCRGEQLLLRFFGEWSRQLKLIRASLAIQGAEQNGRPFSKLQIKRRGQREKVASSNRLPRFLIKVSSAPANYETEQSAILSVKPRRWLLFVNYLLTMSFVSREIFFL